MDRKPNHYEIMQLIDKRFRASRHVELKRLGDLTPDERAPFRDLERDRDFHGLFVPKPPLSVNLKSVSRQTAELFNALSEPSQIPLNDFDYANDVVELVLDGILEIEHDSQFVSGAAAYPILCDAIGDTEPQDAAARLSRDALLYAQDLATTDAPSLTNALYLYNRIPLSPFWRARFPDREAILEYVGAKTLRDWNDTSQNRPTAWLSWTSPSAMPASPDRVTYKLYVSPRPERIRDAFQITARVLAGFPGTQFKLGDSAAGLLRPDKLVTYFTSREQMQAAAAELRRELAGCEAHGVPFTAGLDDTGLLSWGVDPPDNERALQWLGRESWRFWLVTRLGAALSIAKVTRGAVPIEPWRFAVERARRQGIDVDTWTPSAALWSDR